MLVMHAMLAQLPGVLPAAAPSQVAWAYAIFLAIVLVLLAVDLGVFHREAHEVRMTEALKWSAVWVSCGLAFTGVVYAAYENHWLGLGLNTAMYNPASATQADVPLIVNGTVSGADAAKQYLVGYVVEQSLSMDNIFVIALLFGSFAIPSKYQHRVLFWGIMGALVMRGLMIGIGGAIIMKYQWVLIIFGLFLVGTALKMALIKGAEKPSDNPVLRWVQKVYPVTDFFDGQKFFTKRTIQPTYTVDPATGKERQDPPPPGTLRAGWAVTPLFLALVMVEITDLVFAVDSIPAIFAITPDPFIIFTSNIFAILGLRSLYFCVAALVAKFRFLKPALIVILGYVGLKLLLLSVPPYLGLIGLEARKAIKLDTSVSLFIVLGTLAVAMGLSVWMPDRKTIAALDGPPTPGH
ncbi:MAG: TerC family protein [Phycisphaerales bacterium]